MLDTAKNPNFVVLMATVLTKDENVMVVQIAVMARMKKIAEKVMLSSHWNVDKIVDKGNDFHCHR